MKGFKKIWRLSMTLASEIVILTCMYTKDGRTEIDIFTNDKRKMIRSPKRTSREEDFLLKLIVLSS